MTKFRYGSQVKIIDEDSFYFGTCATVYERGKENNVQYYYIIFPDYEKPGKDRKEVYREDQLKPINTDYV